MTEKKETVILELLMQTNILSTLGLVCNYRLDVIIVDLAYFFS